MSALLLAAAAPPVIALRGAALRANAHQTGRSCHACRWARVRYLARTVQGSFSRRRIWHLWAVSPHCRLRHPQKWRPGRDVEGGRGEAPRD